jgi:hypothetical protein
MIKAYIDNSVMSTEISRLFNSDEAKRPYSHKDFSGVDAYGAKVLTREEEMKRIRACRDRRDWMHPERSIT